MKASGSDTRYIYAVGRIRVLETAFLGDGDLEEVLEEEDLPGSIRVLSGFRAYAALAERPRDKSAFEDFLSAELLATYELIYKMARDKGLIEPFLAKSKAFAGGVEGGPEGLDARLWEAFYGSWKGNGFLRAYVKMAIDLENIKIFFRTKLLGRERGFLEGCLIDGGHLKKKDLASLFDKAPDEISSKIGAGRYQKALSAGLEEYREKNSISLLEKACDDLLNDYLKRAKFFHFGIEPLIAYILAKENEVRNLRLILIGKNNNFTAEEIRPYLRNSYV